MEARLIELEPGDWLVSTDAAAAGLPLPTLDAALAVADAFMHRANVRRLTITWNTARTITLDGAVDEDDDFEAVEALFRSQR